MRSSAKALLEYLSTFLSAQAFDSLYCGKPRQPMLATM